MSDEFRIRLQELLKEYGMSIEGDYMGDINLRRGNVLLGYWLGIITNEQWVSFE